MADGRERERAMLAKAFAASSKRRRLSDVERRAAADELRQLLRRGKELGMPVAEMARLAEISRETAHRALRGREET